MPGLAQCRNTFVQYWSLTGPAPWTVERVVAVFTVRFAVSLEEVLSAELLVALVAGETLWVPGVTQGSDHLAHYGLPAGSTDSLLLDFNSLLVHVLLEVSQHHVKVGGPSYHRLVNISPVHLEGVEGHHEMIQLCKGKHVSKYYQDYSRTDPW